MLLFCLVIVTGLLVFFAQPTTAYAVNEKVQVITETCKLYKSPKLDYSAEDPEADGVLLTLSFGDILSKNGSDEIAAEDLSGFYFYSVSIDKDGTNYEGYIIINFVMNASDLPLERKLDPNARTLRRANVYSNKSEENKLVLSGEEVVLEQYQDVKILDGYSAAKDFHEIMFELDGTIYRGYIKTSDLVVEGFDGTIILVVFILILVLSIAFSIYMTTRKKRKKLRSRNK